MAGKNFKNSLYTIFIQYISHEYTRLIYFSYHFFRTFINSRHIIKYEQKLFYTENKKKKKLKNNITLLLC